MFFCSALVTNFQHICSRIYIYIYIYIVYAFMFLSVYHSALMLVRFYWLSLDIYDVRVLIYVTLLRIETNLVEKASLSVTLSSLLLYREEKPTRAISNKANLKYYSGKNKKNICTFNFTFALNYSFSGQSFNCGHYQPT